MAANSSFRIKLMRSAGDGELFAQESQIAVRAFSSSCETPALSRIS